MKKHWWESFNWGTLDLGHYGKAVSTGSSWAISPSLPKMFRCSSSGMSQSFGSVEQSKDTGLGAGFGAQCSWRSKFSPLHILWLQDFQFWYIASENQFSIFLNRIGPFRAGPAVTEQGAFDVSVSLLFTPCYDSHPSPQ